MCVFEFMLGPWHAYSPVIFIGVALVSCFLACYAFVTRRRLTLAWFLVALVCQVALLTLLLSRRTPLIAFEARLPAGSPVLAPELYDALWLAFVGSTLVAILTGMAPGIWSWLRDRPSAAKLGRAGIAALVLQAVLLVAVMTSVSTFRDQVRQKSLVSEPSADGYEVRLVAYDCWIDVNGVILCREPGAFWWRSVGPVEDVLTQSRFERFEWLGPSTAALVLKPWSDAEERVQIDCRPPKLGVWHRWRIETQPDSGEN